MADDDVVVGATTATPVTFRPNHLVRLRGFNHHALDGKLIRIATYINEATGKFEVAFLDDQTRPPVPVVPARRMLIAPEHFIHACEYCLVAASPTVDGGRLQMCGRCKTARYCNAACQGADWARHKSPDCFHFSHWRGWDTPLQQACARGDVAEVRRLVEQGAGKDEATLDGATPLLMAAQQGYLVVVRYLVEQGADKDKVTNLSATPLYIAAQNGHLAVVRYLVEQGADIDQATSAGTTPLMVAVKGGYTELAAYLRAAGAK